MYYTRASRTGVYKAVSRRVMFVSVCVCLCMCMCMCMYVSYRRSGRSAFTPSPGIYASSPTGGFVCVCLCAWVLVIVCVCVFERSYKGVHECMFVRVLCYTQDVTEVRQVGCQLTGEGLCA